MAVELGPVIPRRRLGAELKRLRQERDKKLAEVAHDLLISNSKLSRLETGQAVPTDRDMRDFLRYYDLETTGLGERLKRWAVEAREEPWWQDAPIPTITDHYISFETAADQIRAYVANFVPSLLQTEDYARSLLTALKRGAGSDLELQIQVLLRRQQAVTRLDSPVDIDMIIDESVFHRMAGSASTMREQLKYMAKAAERPNVVLRVFPFASGPHPAMQEGTFSLFHYNRKIDPDVVFLEGMDNDDYLDHVDQVQKYKAALDDLSKRSLRPDQSRQFIRSMADTYLSS